MIIMSTGPGNRPSGLSGLSPGSVISQLCDRRLYLLGILPQFPSVLSGKNLVLISKCSCEG